MFDCLSIAASGGRPQTRGTDLELHPKKGEGSLYSITTAPIPESAANQNATAEICRFTPLNLVALN
jgi:hypothetical protein